ncbi:hypothetical protein [Bradyrhizobium brasilense]|uniref:Transposase n=1 Tax=Bradyrhizobium brasilense TaxID=1419277 RepID=A0ABY8JDQ2_9BRAD|nr:hypothetical protein [Bradyrhizobium brasilense]WFU62581.1 hypothetical protein QA636_34755 [Bradyrhizobium brasilense]
MDAAVVEVILRIMPVEDAEISKVAKRPKVIKILALATFALDHGSLQAKLAARTAAT